MISMFLTGAGILDNILDGLQFPDEAMFKFWLKSDEFEGIKNTLKDSWYF